MNQFSLESGSPEDAWTPIWQWKAWAQVMPCSYLDQPPQPPTSQRKHGGIIWAG